MPKKRMRALTTYQMVCVIVAYGFQKVRAGKTQSGEYRYFLKGLTGIEWTIFEDEDLSDQEVEARIEPGGWMIVDCFTASVIKQVYEALKPESRATFDRVPLTKLAELGFKHAI